MWLHGDRLIKLPCQGLLFDLDGTLVNSIAAVDRAWRRWAVEFGLDPDFVAPQIHGRRAKDSIALLAPHLDQELAFHRLEHLEATDTDGVVALPGALEFLDSLESVPWGIVTSGTMAIARPRLAAGGIQPPVVFVTAEMVERGKPFPDPFLEGAHRLNIEASSIIAFEDTLAGVRSAHAAGMQVVGLSSEAHAESEISVADFSGLKVERFEDAFALINF